MRTCSSRQCLCFSEICLRSACFSFSKLSRHREPQSSFSSSHRDFSCKTTNKNCSYSFGWRTIRIVDRCEPLEGVKGGGQVGGLTSSRLWSLNKAMSLSSCFVCSFS